VVRTPRSGFNLTHRIGLHLDGAAKRSAGDNPRATAEPGLNQWLSDLLPDLNTVGIRVSYQLPSYDGSPAPAPTDLPVITLAQLEVQPLDLIFLMGETVDNNWPALDDLIVQHGFRTHNLRLDAEIQIHYTDPVPGFISLFELSPLVGHLRALSLGGRPLRPSDLALPNEADVSQDNTLIIDRSRLDEAIAALSALNTAGPGVTSVPNFLAEFPAAMDELSETDIDTLVDNIDAYCISFTEVKHALSFFGPGQGGYRFAFEGRKQIYQSLFEKLNAYILKWEEKLAAFDDLSTTQYATAGTDEERFKLLQKAERQISLTSILPLPASPDTSKNDLIAGKRLAFETKLNALKGLNDPAGQSKLSGLVQAIQAWLEAAPAATEFELEPLDLAEERKNIRVLAEDLHKQATVLTAKLSTQLDKAKTLLLEFEAAVDSKKRSQLLNQVAQSLFGEDFQLFPAYQLSPEQAAELQNSFGARNQLLDYQRTQQGNAFPVDEWLYGVARVREKMGHWESAVMLAENQVPGLQMELHPFQLPYNPNDAWLALEFPEEKGPDRDKLLYTAFAPGFDGNKPLCGILLDEWTEVIPTRKETTGLTFHFDQPNNEAPQSLLLVTPSDFRGEWTWIDLVDALHETLDLCRTRAIEPVQIDRSAYAHFLPATVSTVTYYPVTIALNHAVNNGLKIKINE